MLIKHKDENYSIVTVSMSYKENSIIYYKVTLTSVIFPNSNVSYVFLFSKKETANEFINAIIKVEQIKNTMKTMKLFLLPEKAISERFIKLSQLVIIIYMR